MKHMGPGKTDEIKQYIAAHHDAETIEIRAGRVVEIRDLGAVETIKSEARRWHRGPDVDDIGDIHHQKN